jgi:hypothetical protein
MSFGCNPPSNPLGLGHRDALRAVVGDVVRGHMDRNVAAAHVPEWTSGHIAKPEGARFHEIAKDTQ